MCLLVGLVLVGQFMVIVQCGSLHRRLGPRMLEESDNTMKELVGQSIDLKPSGKFVFGSLTCGNCLTIFRSLKDIDPNIEMFLADAENEEHVKGFNLRFPELKGSFAPGKEVFNNLGIEYLPIFIQTNDEQKIETIETLSSPQELKQLLS